MEQHMDRYTIEDLMVWQRLFDRQEKNLQFKGSRHYLKALKKMNSVLNQNELPDFSKINSWFISRTGWKIEVVPGLIEVDEFFKLLAQKRFCSSTWLRSMENLDYLEEPDMFHDIFGHIPLLSNPVFSDFAHEFGKLGVKFAGNERAQVALQRLYWFTIEFGVIQEDDKTMVYGAGIISSFGETNRVIDENCSILKFDIDAVLNKIFRTDVMQEEYFLISSLEELYDGLSVVKTKLKEYELVERKR